MTTLYLCEKPSQARDIAGVLNANNRGEGYLSDNKGIIVTWCLGHLLEQAPPEHYCKDIKPWRAWKSCQSFQIVPISTPFKAAFPKPETNVSKPP